MAPGYYLPDRTEGITRVEDLPEPLVVPRSRHYHRRACPHCGRACYRDNTGRRVLHDVGSLLNDRPRDLHVASSRHYCARCRLYFSADLSDLAPPGSHYTHRVISLASAWSSRMACPTGALPGTCGATTASSSPTPPSRTGSRPRGKKAQPQVEAGYLDWALAGFSGYLVVDELYDGPFCVLSAVDGPKQRRLLYAVLDHDPDHADVRRFLGRLSSAIAARGGVVRGITTDGSALYPQPLAEVFPGVPHQVCEFHVLKELTKAVLRALAGIRKKLAAQAPKLPRGRPKDTPEARRAHRRAKRIKQRVAELFEHRHLFVRHHLTPSQRVTLKRLLRGEARLQALRAIMDEVYRLFDRRCRTDTALAKLARLRRRLRRYCSLGRSLDKLKSPNLEKALVFLDDKLMPATSNAVERGNRRHRKMQQGVYRVRRWQWLKGRMALDLQRDQHTAGRRATSACLHKSRG
jgi:hypothetical protein